MSTVQDAQKQLSAAITDEKKGLVKRIAELDALQRLANPTATTSHGTAKKPMKVKVSAAGAPAAFLAAITKTPGMSATDACKAAKIRGGKNLMVKIRKELVGKIRTEGVKRATRYFPA